MFPRWSLKLTKIIPPIINRRWSGLRNLPVLAVIFFLGFQFQGGKSVPFSLFKTDDSSPEVTGCGGKFSLETDSDEQAMSQSDSWVYFTQAGDTLQAVAARFQVRLQDIQGPSPWREDQLLDPGMRLIIPRPFDVSSSIEQIFPDSELVYSPTVLGFDTLAYVSQKSGFLSTDQEYMRSTGPTNGAMIVERIALENSINPRLLLALLDYQCGCVTGNLRDDVDPDYLMGVDDPMRKGLYRQLGWVVNQLSLGYYGWRQGLLTDLRLLDGTHVQLPPDLNAGSVSLAYLFSRLYDRQGWDRAMDPQDGFNSQYHTMFDDSEVRVNEAEPLFPPGLAQPQLILPFQPDRQWGFTSGPHKAWETEAALAALDFAPASAQFGCDRSNAWVVAVADGLVVRSEQGAVVLDLDGDGFEGTGWAVLYMHIESRGRVAPGTYLQRGDPVGHPSCEGGPANGTHVHIARKFNGEWIAADGPLPFEMSGWVAHAGFRPFEGSLTRGDQTVVANPLSPGEAFIHLSAEEMLLYAKHSRDLWWEE